jgi:hypothetical protein
MFLYAKTIKGNKYWYARENEWRNGKSVTMWEEYLGTAEDIYRKLKEG